MRYFLIVYVFLWHIVYDNYSIKSNKLIITFRLTWQFFYCAHSSCLQKVIVLRDYGGAVIAFAIVFKGFSFLLARPSYKSSI